MIGSRHRGRQSPDGPPTAGERVRAGRTRASRWPRAVWPAALALAAVAALASWWRPDDAATPRGALTLIGHAVPVESVAFAPDGRILASCGIDQTVRLWETGRWGDGDPGPLDILVHRSCVYAAAFSPGGSLLATAGDGFAALWSCHPGRERLAEWVGASYHAVAFSPDGRTLALGGEDGVIRLLEVPSGRERTTLGDPARDPVRSIAFATDGRLLASATCRGGLVVWDAGRGEVHRVLRGRGSRPIPSMAFSPDGRSVAAVEPDDPHGAVLIFDVEGGGLRARHGGDGLANSIGYAPDGRFVAVGGADRRVRLLDPATGRSLGAVDVGEEWPRSLAISPDGRWLACAAGFDAVRVVDLAGRKP